MPDQLMIRLRLPLLLLAALCVLAMSAGPAFAGEDDDDVPPPPAPPVVQPVPVPVVPPAATPVPPAPTPVPPAPTPVPPPVVTPPVQPTPQPTPQPKPKAKPKPKVATKAVQKTTTPVQQTPVTVRRVQAVQAATPQGGIQAGAGGTAPQSASHSVLPLGVAALVLSILALGSASLLTYMRARR